MTRLRRARDAISVSMGAEGPKNGLFGVAGIPPQDMHLGDTPTTELATSAPLGSRIWPARTRSRLGQGPRPDTSGTQNAPEKPETTDSWRVSR